MPAIDIGAIQTKGPGAVNGMDIGAIQRANPAIDQEVILRRTIENNLECLSFTWRTDSNGALTYWMPDSLDGTLHRFVARHNDLVSGSTYDIWLYDPLEHDVLIGYAENLTYNATIDGPLRKQLGSPPKAVRTIPVMGRHKFVINTGTDQTYGVFELYVWQFIEPRLTNAGVH